MPVDAERFRASVRRYVEQTPIIEEWLTERGIVADELFLAPLAAADLEEVIRSLVANTAIYGPRTDTLNRFARCAQFLLDSLRAVTETVEIEAEAARLLGMRVN
jgi:hypothetical protein